MEPALRHLSKPLRGLEVRQFNGQIFLKLKQLFWTSRCQRNVISHFDGLDPAPGIEKKLHNKNRHDGHPDEDHLPSDLFRVLVFSHPEMSHYRLSAALNLALLAIGFVRISSGPGRIGFFVNMRRDPNRPQTHVGKSGGHVHGFSRALKRFFTIRSSREWNDITHKRPPEVRRSGTRSNKVARFSNSRFTAILSAMNTRVAGWILREAAPAGLTTEVMISLNCRLDCIR